MDAVSVIVAIGLAFLVGVFIARPWLAQDPERMRLITPATELTAERETILLALRELDFDHLTGKITDDDYAPQRAALVARGVTLLQQLEEVAEAPPDAAENQLEAEVRAARARRAERQPAPGFCPQCGASRQATDRFCAKCGAALAVLDSVA